MTMEHEDVRYEGYGIECGLCGGQVYMETCPLDGHEWATAAECQQCGERTAYECHACRLEAPAS